MDGHVDPGPHDAPVPSSILLFIDDVAVQQSCGHLTERLDLASPFFRPHELLSARSLQLLAWVPQEIAEALVDSQPLPVQAHVHDPDWRRIERRPVKTLALGQVGRPRDHLVFKHLGVDGVVKRSSPFAEATRTRTSRRSSRVARARSGGDVACAHAWTVGPVTNSATANVRTALFITFQALNVSDGRLLHLNSRSFRRRVPDRTVES